MRAKALAQLGRTDEAREIARDVQSGVRMRGVVERAQRVHLELADALALAGDADGALRARADALAIVETQLTQIRDPQLRERYLATRLVQSIRSELGAQP